MTVQGLVAVITGASSGIGAATAELFAERGASVMLAARSADRMETLVERIAASGGRAVYERCDVTVEADVQRLFERAAETFGGVDVLVNNAAVAEVSFAPRVDLEGMSVDDFRRVLEVNLVAAWLCAKYALPYLRRSANPSIVNAGSSATFLGFQGLPAYGATKAGISSLTKELAVELSRDGIRVNCYCPHTIRTPMLDGLFAKAEDPEAYAERHVRTALVRRFGDPREVAQLICFLASDEARYINGVSIPIDGCTLAWRGTVDQLG